MPNTGPYIAFDGEMGNPWTVVVRVWDAACTAWRGIALTGQIAGSAEHAIKLVKMNGPWPEGAEFRAFPPGDPMGRLIWGDTPAQNHERNSEHDPSPPATPPA